MDKAPEDNTPLPAELKWLKRLVIALAGVMIAGFLVLILTLVIRLREVPPAFPDLTGLPEGTLPYAVTRGPEWIAVVTTDGAILILSPDGATLRQTLTID